MAAASPIPAWLVRPFNHAGPRQSPAYATSAFAQQIADIEAGRRDPVLHVGNLDAQRDITDVRDTVRAYHAIVCSGQARRPYNVCSGRAHTMRRLLDILLSLARVRVRVEIDPARLRPSDNPVILGSHARLTADTGWTPVIPIEQTLADLLEHWRRSHGRMMRPRRASTLRDDAAGRAHGDGRVRPPAAVDPMVAGGRAGRGGARLQPVRAAAPAREPLPARRERARGPRDHLVSARGAAAARDVPAPARHRRRRVGDSRHRRRHRDARRPRDRRAAVAVEPREDAERQRGVRDRRRGGRRLPRLVVPAGRDPSARVRLHDGRPDPRGARGRARRNAAGQARRQPVGRRDGRRGDGGGVVRGAGPSARRDRPRGIPAAGGARRSILWSRRPATGPTRCRRRAP